MSTKYERVDCRMMSLTVEKMNIMEEMKEKATKNAKRMGLDLFNFKYMSNKANNESLFVATCYNRTHNSIGLDKFIVFSYDSTLDVLYNAFYSSNAVETDREFDNR
jgi:hypothetical protein